MEDSNNTNEQKEIFYLEAPMGNEECIACRYVDIEKTFIDAGFESVWPVSYQVEYGHAEYAEGDIVKVEIQENLVEKGKEYDSTAAVMVYIADHPFAREVIFGDYSKEPISWYVVATEGDKYLLVSKYILDYQRFNDTTIASGTTWEDSSLRKWLNDTFYNAAFSATEQKYIISTTVQDYEADGKMGGKTNDKVFILNYDEARKYFPTNDNRKTDDSWWLINSYSSNLYKYVINENGVHENSPRVNESEGIRPAVWVKIEAIEEK